MFGGGMMLFAQCGLQRPRMYIQCLAKVSIVQPCVVAFMRVYKSAQDLFMKSKSTKSDIQPTQPTKASETLQPPNLIRKSSEKPVIPMAIPEVSQEYVVLKDFGEAGGNNNKGISLVRNTKTGEQLICKKVPANIKGEQELRVAKRLRGFDGIVQLRDHASTTDEDTNIHNLYFEHCDIGSLKNLLKRHEYMQQRVPESFIWYVLLSMAKALEIIHTGSADAEKQQGWIPIAHRDVQAGNILLSSSSPTDTTAYPRVVLSDFGASLQSGDLDPLLYRKDIGDLAETIYAMCFCAWDVETAKLEYSEELQGVLAVSDVYWEDTPEEAAKFNSGFVAWVEENMAKANMAEFEGKVVLR